MKKVVFLLAHVGFFLLLMSCADNSPEGVGKWIANEENGLVKEVENEHFKLSVQYRPQTYLVALENKKEKLTEKEFEEKLKEKENLQYFNIKLLSKTGEQVLKTNLESNREENLRLQYYIGAFEYDIFLADGNDTLPCALYHFERTYGALPFNNISVAFENKSQNKFDKTILLYDRALGFNTQIFTFNKKDIANVPQLKLN